MIIPLFPWGISTETEKPAARKSGSCECDFKLTLKWHSKRKQKQWKTIRIRVGVTVGRTDWQTTSDKWQQMSFLSVLSLLLHLSSFWTKMINEVGQKATQAEWHRLLSQKTPTHRATKKPKKQIIRFNGRWYAWSEVRWMIKSGEEFICLVERTSNWKQLVFRWNQSKL